MEASAACRMEAGRKPGACRPSGQRDRARSSGANSPETIGGVEIRSFSPRNVMDACRPIFGNPARHFHSQDPTVPTYLAQRIHPRRAHLVTSHPDPGIERLVGSFVCHPMRRSGDAPELPGRIWVSSSDVRCAGQCGVYCPAIFSGEGRTRIRPFKQLPTLLPNLIDVCRRSLEKPTADDHLCRPLG